jgi:hypothetical protein
MFPPFQPGSAIHDADLALLIERDAQDCRGSEPDQLIKRWLPVIGVPADRPMASLAAAEACLEARMRDGSPPLEAAQRLASAHPMLAEDFMAAALGVGLPEGDLEDTIVEGEVVLGRWRIDRIVGRGSTATVAIATDALLGSESGPRRVALKRFEADASGHALRHARRELATLLTLPDRCAPKVLGFHADRAGSAILVTAWEPSSPPRHLGDLPELLWTVRRVHAAGVAHGDLKPDHLRLRSDGSAFLIDWGSASVADQASRSADADRLASVVRALGQTSGAPSWIVEPARALCEQGCLGLAAAWLALGAPRRHARRLVSTAVPTAIAILMTAVIAWTVGPWSRTPAEAAIARLRARGNLVEVVHGVDGSPAGAWLAWPRFDPAVPARERLVFWIEFKDGIEVISRKSPGSLSPATWPESLPTAPDRTP